MKYRKSDFIYYWLENGMFLSRQMFYGIYVKLDGKSGRWENDYCYLEKLCIRKYYRFLSVPVERNETWKNI